MKKYRALLPIAMIAIMLASWYMLISAAANTDSEYNTYLAVARRWAKDGITKYAMQNYEAALDVKATPELYVEIAAYYEANESVNAYLAWSDRFFEEYPTHPEAYRCLLSAYLKQSDYESCYDLLEVASKRKVESDYITKVSNDIKYQYHLGYKYYQDVSVYSNDYCAVQKKDLWGYVNCYGDVKINCAYESAGVFSTDNMAPVVYNGELFYLDKEGDKIKISPENYSSFGLYTSSMVAAKTTKGKYVYLNANLEKLFGEYDYASAVNLGVAAVKKGDSWSLINESGKEITQEKYKDVKLDEKEIAFRNGRCFAATAGGKYIMVDGTGKQVGTLSFEDARVFASNEPTAVKINGKWCFVGADGKLISDKKYDDARGFCNGMAAVCIDGSWGFVDAEENVVISPTFLDAKDFNAYGSCFVKTDDGWQLLKLYRLNRR